MKILKLLFTLLLLSACSENKNEPNARWQIDISGIGANVEITDITQDLYNLELPISEFRKKYPFYLDPKLPDQEYDTQRRDTAELNLYKQIQQKINKEKIKNELSSLFRHIKYYYPEFKEPQVYLYSSLTLDHLEPVSYNPQSNKMVIAVDCFLGKDNKYYKMMRIYDYLQNSMSQEYIAVKTAKTLINELHLVLRESISQSFISQMIFQGKNLILLDAFLPTTPDEYKIEYTKEQLNWAQSNEFQIWNYFIENKYIFSDDIKLGERFLSLAPFSKFYTDADSKSPGRIGTWIGWQICRKYMKENPKVTLQEFLKNPNGEEIFSKSNYKPEPIAK